LYDIFQVQLVFQLFYGEIIVLVDCIKRGKRTA